MAYLKRSMFFIVAFWISWIASSLFQFAPNASAFYIPAGLSFAFTALYGWRYIPVIYIAAFASSTNFMTGEIGVFSIVHSGVHAFLYGVSGFRFGQLWNGQSRRITQYSAVTLFTIGIGVSFLSAIAAHNLFDLYHLLPADQLGSVFFAFWGGDIAGFIVTAPVVLIAHEFFCKSKRGAFTDTLQGVKNSTQISLYISCLAVAAGTSILPLQIDIDAHVIFLTLIPVTLIAVTYGVVSGIVASILTGATLFISPILSGGGTHMDFELQVFLVVSASISLIVGGAHDDKNSALHRAEHANRAKTELMANMSHELRTPLNAIIGFSGTMKEEIFGPLGNEKYREYLGDILYSGQHLLELINDILDLSAFEESALELSEDNVDITKIVEAAIRMIQPRAEHGQVKVTSSLKPVTPVIYGDERRVRQILLNLLSNAIKFTPEGGKVIVDSLLNDDGSFSVFVSDTGYGMNDDETVVALSKFGQLDSGLDRKHEGTGLGLPLTKALMERHGGILEIDSLEGYGTMATATFPKERVNQNIRFGS